MQVEDNVKKARHRLIQFRNKSLEGSILNVSIHLNALEMAICLTEFSLNTNPTRPISKEEEQWFEAGRYIDLLFGESEWRDLTDLYFKIVAEVKKRDFFRR